MTEINPNMAYYPSSPSASKKKKNRCDDRGWLNWDECILSSYKKGCFCSKSL